MDNDAILARLTEMFQEIFDDDTLTLTSKTAAADVPGQHRDRQRDVFPFDNFSHDVFPSYGFR